MKKIFDMLLNPKIWENEINKMKFACQPIRIYVTVFYFLCTLFTGATENRTYNIVRARVAHTRASDDQYHPADCSFAYTITEYIYV